jgi:hypothetical protein
MAALGQLNGMVDPQEFLRSILEDLGFKNPEAIILPPGMPSQQALMMALEMVAQQLGPDGQGLVEAALNQAMDAEQAAQQQGGGQQPQEAPPEG